MEPKRPLTCSVILCTRNRPDDVVTFLASLKHQTTLPNELIVVDSSDRMLQEHESFCRLQNEFKQQGIHVVYVHTRPGLTYQRNQGVAHSTGKILYFFDDDVILAPDCLQEMQQVFADNSRYAGGMCNVTNDTYQMSWFDRALRRLFLLSRHDPRGIFTPSGMPMHPYGSQLFAEVEVLGGCCMAYRRAVFARHHFDERLGRYAYMEDVDLSYRVSRYAPLFYNPKARLQHMQSPLSRDKMEENRAMFIRNYSYLFFKNMYPHARWRIILYWWSILGLFVQFLLIRDLAFLRGYVRGLREFRQTGLPAS